MKFGIVVYPGSNCDHDCYHVLKNVVNAQVEYIWHTTSNITKYDCIILPGGFSYGDYLRPGAMAAHSPVMDSIRIHVAKGKLVIGICNGFQILTEAKLLPGALMINKNGQFICAPTRVIITRNKTNFTRMYTKEQEITIPIAHKEGRYIIDSIGLNELINNKQIVLRYLNNPNGSTYDIAGITNKEGNVFGLMPHPERVSEKILGSTDGLNVFRGLVV